MKRERLDILAKKFASESISSGEIINYNLFVNDYGNCDEWIYLHNPFEMRCANIKI